MGDAEADGPGDAPVDADVIEGADAAVPQGPAAAHTEHPSAVREPPRGPTSRTRLSAERFAIWALLGEELGPEGAWRQFRARLFPKFHPLMIFLGVVSGCMAGFLGGLFGAGGPPILVLFAWVSMNPQYGISPMMMRCTGQVGYWSSCVVRVVVLAIDVHPCHSALTRPRARMGSPQRGLRCTT